MIYRILGDPYYYGESEYPIGSDMYRGNQDPIISKELYLKVREKMTVAPKRHPEQ